MKRNAKQNQYGHLMVAAALLSAVVGCGGTYDASVSGVVTLDGKPLERGQVSFHPASAGSSAIGRINSQGKYEVSTGLESGLPSGEYIITVVAYAPPVQSESDRGGPPAAGKLITPEWYKTKQFSGLKQSIASGSNDIPLALTSEPPSGWSDSKTKRRSGR